MRRTWRFRYSPPTRLRLVEGLVENGGCDRCYKRPMSVGPRVAGLTGVTLESAPDVCHGCVWWQSRPGKHTDKERWIEKAETEWGPWGTVYYDNDGRLLGSMQYGPAELFPRAAALPAGPPSADAVLVTCAYLVETSTPFPQARTPAASERTD